MKDGKIERSDAAVLMAIYRKIDIDGYVREPVTTDEMITLFAIAKALEKGFKSRKGKKKMAIGIVRTLETPDGVKWVHLEDYQQLLRKYEELAGVESNSSIIARVGADEVPE